MSIHSPKGEIWEGCPGEMTFELSVAGSGRFLFSSEKKGKEQPRQSDKYAQKHSGRRWPIQRIALGRY